MQDANWKCESKDAHPHNKPPTQASEKTQPEERGRESIGPLLALVMFKFKLYIGFRYVVDHQQAARAFKTPAVKQNHSGMV